MNEIVQPYTSALMALAVLVLLVVVQSFHSTFINGIKRDGTPGKPVEGSHTDQHWRLYRAHQNSVENFSIFAASVFAAILVGVSVWWLTILAWVHVAARVAHWIIYIMGVGTIGGGPRTMAFVIGFFSTAIIAFLVLFAGLF